MPSRPPLKAVTRDRSQFTHLEAFVDADRTPRGRGAIHPRGLVIFDGDDTMWRTQELYDRAKTRFATLLAHHGLTDQNPIAILDRIDAEAVDAQAFTVRRFVDSMLTTYHVLSKAHSREPEAQVENQIRRLGKPLVGEYRLYPDALPALKRLAPRFQVVLATKGDPELQRQKVRRLGLARFFDQIYLMERKTEKEYMEILSAHQMHPNRVWAVGNSIRSDINPALKLGIRSVLIQRPTWLYEEAQLRPGRVAIVDSINAACRVILESESRMAASLALPL